MSESAESLPGAAREPLFEKSITERLADYANSLGVDPDQAAELLRDHAATERVQAFTNMNVILEQGEAEQSLNLRLVPYLASCTFSVHIVPAVQGPQTEARQDITVVRTRDGFRRRQSAESPKLGVSGGSMMYGKPEVTSYNDRVFVAGALIPDRHTTLTPTVENTFGLYVSNRLDSKYGGQIDDTDLVGSWCSKVVGATISYQDQEHIIFGEPYLLHTKTGNYACDVWAK